MKILFSLSLFFIVTYAQAMDTDTNNPFDTIGNYNLYDHITPNAHDNANKIGIHSIKLTPNKTMVILNNGKKYYRIQERDSNGNIINPSCDLQKTHTIGQNKTFNF